MSFEIREHRDEDWPGVWAVLEPIFRAGETYPVSPDVSEAEARAGWTEAPHATYVALDAEDGSVLGTYYVKANQLALGAHVANCGYAVGAAARGRGVASAMCVHSQEAARAAGFTHMQYNLVVSTNEGARRLWLKHGFEIVGTLPQAFRHKRLGLVDAHVMYKTL